MLFSQTLSTFYSIKEWLIKNENEKGPYFFFSFFFLFDLCSILYFAGRDQMWEKRRIRCEVSGLCWFWETLNLVP